MWPFGWSCWCVYMCRALHGHGGLLAGWFQARPSPLRPGRLGLPSLWAPTCSSPSSSLRPSSPWCATWKQGFSSSSSHGSWSWGCLWSSYYLRRRAYPSMRWWRGCGRNTGIGSDTWITETIIIIRVILRMLLPTDVKLDQKDTEMLRFFPQRLYLVSRSMVNVGANFSHMKKFIWIYIYIWSRFDAYVVTCMFGQFMVTMWCCPQSMLAYKNPHENRPLCYIEFFTSTWTNPLKEHIHIPTSLLWAIDWMHG